MAELSQKGLFLKQEIRASLARIVAAGRPTSRFRISGCLTSVLPDIRERVTLGTHHFGADTQLNERFEEKLEKKFGDPLRNGITLLAENFAREFRAQSALNVRHAAMLRARMSRGSPLML